MYTIAGRFGFKRGPFTDEQVRQKIAAGQLKPQTRARRQGSSKWQPLAGFPEFADDFGPRVSPAPAPTPGEPAAASAAGPASPTVLSAAPSLDVQALANALLARGFRVDIASCFQRSWGLLMHEPLVPVGAAIVAILVFCLLEFLLDLLMFGAIELNQTLHHTVAIFLGGLVACGLSAFYLHLIRAPESLEEAIKLAEAWWGDFQQAIHGDRAALGRRFHGFGPRLAPLILTVVALSAPLAVGAFLVDVGQYLPSSAGSTVRLIAGLVRLAAAVPVVYFTVAWWLAPVLVFDKGFKAREALALSRRVVAPHGVLVGVVVALTLALGVLGYFACRVGLLAALPVGLFAVLFMYEDIFGVRSEQPGGSNPDPAKI